MCTLHYIPTANVELFSSVDEGKQFICPGELVNFTCEVFGSFSLKWRSNHTDLITYTAVSIPPNTFTQSPFKATLTSASPGVNPNITSTLMMTEPRDTVSVQCLNAAQKSEMKNFTITGNNCYC